MREKRLRVLRWIVLSGILLICFLLQMNTGHLLEIRSIRPMPLLPLVVCIGMFERDLVGASFGLAAGIMWDSTVPGVPGFHALFLMMAGCVCGLLIAHLMRNNVATGIMLCLAATVLYTLLYWLFYIAMRGWEGTFFALLRYLLPSAGYTLLFMPPFYFMVRGIMKRMRVSSQGAG